MVVGGVPDKNKYQPPPKKKKNLFKEPTEVIPDFFCGSLTPKKLSEETSIRDPKSWLMSAGNCSEYNRSSSNALHWLTVITAVDYISFPGRSKSSIAWAERKEE